jgi:hypothetical protein
VITKTQAAQLQAQYIQKIPDRVEQQIVAAALAGQTSVLISYAPASPAQATAFINTQLTPNGWTVSLRDDVNFTFVIS